MAGTMNRVERIGSRLCAVLAFGCLLTLPQRALAVDVADAFAISLAADDLESLAAGIKETYFAAPLTGHSDERYEQNYWFSSFGVEGLSYSVTIDQFALSLRDGRLRAGVTLKDLNVTVDKIFFNTAGTFYCSDMPLGSNDGAVAVAGDLYPKAADHSLTVGVSGVYVGLNSGNFIAGPPAACYTFWGFNWLLRHSLPLIANLLRPSLEYTIERRIEAAATLLTSNMSQLLTANITQPFHLPPTPAFYGTFGLWPSSVSVSAERFDIAFGASIDFDTDRRRARRGRLDETTGPLLQLASQLPSYFGVSRKLIESTIAEANRQGLFQALINGETLPEAATLLNVGNLAAILPDSLTRFAADKPLDLRMQGGGNVAVALHSSAMGGIPIIAITIDDLAASIDVDGQAYFDLLLKMTLTFQAGVRADDDRLLLGLKRVQTRFKSGSFSEHLVPAPLDRSINRASINQFLDQIDSQLRQGGSRLLSVTLPRVALGGYALEYAGSSARDDFVTMDARVVSTGVTGGDW